MKPAIEAYFSLYHGLSQSEAAFNGNIGVKEAVKCQIAQGVFGWQGQLFSPDRIIFMAKQTIKQAPSPVFEPEQIWGNPTAEIDLWGKLPEKVIPYEERWPDYTIFEQ